MAVDYLVDGLELECFEEVTSRSAHETVSDVKALVLTACYGRGKTLTEISIPRLPNDVSTRVVIPEVDPRQLLPTRKRAGRGRARVLCQDGGDSIRPQPPRKVEPLKSVPQKPSVFELPVADPVCFASYPGATDVDSFEYFYSDDEESEEYVPLLPSQRGITNHPFGAPPKPKKAFNVKSADEFPTLGAQVPRLPDVDTNNSATNVRIFPSLPPRLSKKVINNDIVFKPMKEKKKKKRKSGDSSSSKKTGLQEKGVSSLMDEQDYESLDGDIVRVRSRKDSLLESLNTESTQNVEDEQELPHCNNLDTKGDDEVWRIDGECVIQVDGLPDGGDIKEFESLLSNYGTVTNVENIRHSSGKFSVRVQYTEQDECDFAVSCLHDSDCVFPDCCLQCYMVNKDKH